MRKRISPVATRPLKFSKDFCCVCVNIAHTRGVGDVCWVCEKRWVCNICVRQRKYVWATKKMHRTHVCGLCHEMLVDTRV